MSNKIFVELRVPGFEREPFVVQSYKALRTPITSVERLNNVVEETSKFMTYRRLRQMGMSPEEASYETRTYGGSPDFMRMGTLSPMYNLMFMFFNANVQGTIRTFTRALENPKRMGLLLAQLGMMQTALQTWNSHFKNPEDGLPEWMHVSSQDKKRYFILLAPWLTQDVNGQWRHQYFRLPKGYALQQLFNPIQDGIDMVVSKYVFEQPTVSAAETTRNIIEANLPGNFDLAADKLPIAIAKGFVANLNPAAKWLAEESLNEDTYRHMKIVAPSLDGLEAKLKVNPSTSPVAEHFAAGARAVPWLRDLSWFTEPVRAEHMIRTFFGGFSNFLLTLEGSPAGKLKSSTQKVREIPGAGPLLSVFLGSEVDEVLRRDEKKFYDAFEEAETAYKSFLKLKGSPEKQAEMMQDPKTATLIKAGPQFRNTVEGLSTVRRLMVRAMADETKSDDEKRKLVANYVRKRKEVLAWALGDFFTALDKQRMQREIARDTKEREKKQTSQPPQPLQPSSTPPLPPASSEVPVFARPSQAGVPTFGPVEGTL